MSRILFPPRIAVLAIPVFLASFPLVPCLSGQVREQPADNRLLRQTWTVETNTDRPGLDLTSLDLAKPDPALCLAACQQNASCKAYTYVKPGVQAPAARCWLKSAIPNPVNNDCCVSGVPEPPTSQTLTGNAAQIAEGNVALFTYSASEGFEIGIDRPGSDYRDFAMPDPRPDLCRAACEKDGSCKAFTFVRGGLSPGPQAHCWLKNSAPAISSNAQCVSGTPRPPTKTKAAAAPVVLTSPPAPIAEQSSPFDQIDWQRHQREHFVNLNPDLRAVQQQLFRQSVARATSFGQGLNMAATVAQPELLRMLVNGLQPPPTAQKAASPYTSPQLERVLSVSSTEAEGTIDEGGYLFITGKHFGSLPGTLRLTYATRKEFAPIAYYDIDLLPATGSWKDSWFDDLIAVRVPFFTEPFSQEAAAGLGAGSASVLTADPPPKLTLLVGGSSQAKTEHTVKIVRRGVGISYLIPFPTLPKFDYIPGMTSLEVGSSAVMAGGALDVYGSGFGPADGNGSAWIELTDAITPFNRPPTKRVDFNIVSWTDTKVVLKVPPELQGDYPFRGGMFYIENPSLGRSSQGMFFGPRMELYAVSGERYFEPAKDQDPKDKWITAGNIMTVVHEAGCGVQGNHGDDWFFKGKPLSPNAVVHKAMVYWQKPGDDDTIIWTWAGNLVKDWFTDFWKGLGESVLYMLGGMFGGPGYMSYKVEVPFTPQPDNPRFLVHWENTCWGPFSGKPITYMTTFMIWEPADTILTN